MSIWTQSQNLLAIIILWQLESLEYNYFCVFEVDSSYKMNPQLRLPLQYSVYICILNPSRAITQSLSVSRISQFKLSCRDKDAFANFSVGESKAKPIFGWFCHKKSVMMQFITVRSVHKKKTDQIFTSWRTNWLHLRADTLRQRCVNPQITANMSSQKRVLPAFALHTAIFFLLTPPNLLPYDQPKLPSLQPYQWYMLIAEKQDPLFYSYKSAYLKFLSKE